MFNQKLIQELESYISQHRITSTKRSKFSEVTPKLHKQCSTNTLTNHSFEESAATYSESTVNDKDIKNYILHHRAPKFNEVLFTFIDDKNLEDSTVYKKANIDRRLFSKIRTNPDYKPKKTTVLSLGLALELPLEDLVSLLKSAGYALGKSDTLDLVIHFCLEKRIYNIIEVNLLLDYFSIKEL